MAIILDFNPVVIAAVHTGGKEFGESLNENMIRHLVLNMILSYRKKFVNEYGRLIIACDSNNGKSWRRDFFPYYKIKRSESREKSALDWGMVFKSLDIITDELIQYLPYHVVKVSSCEADDIIAVLTKHITENEPIVKGIYEEDQPILILSGDKDFKQLHKYKNVKQYIPREKKYMPKESNAEKFLIEHIIRGDTGDSIPNIFSDDDCFAIKKRQKNCTEALVEKCLLNVPAEYQDNYNRNKRLIDLSETPELKHGKLSNARAIAVFIKDKIDNQAYEPLTNEVSIRILSEQDIQQGEYSPQQTDAATAYQLVPFVVPDFVFKEFYLLSTQEKEIKQAWDHIWSAYIGGQATWIQNEEYEGQFIGQLSDLTDELNLGDNGVLYIFANTAFWQCH